MRERKAIGIDIGGTRIAVGAVHVPGVITAKKTFPTNPQAGFNDAMERIRMAVKEVLFEADWSLDEIDGIGVGCTGPVNTDLGIVENCFTLPSWEGKNLVAALEGDMGKKTYLENDANTALLGEHIAGVARDVGNVVMFTLGTGVGSAVLIGGQLYRGMEGGHPELGHMPIDPEGPECYCGQTGCLESLVSGGAIGQWAEACAMADSHEVFAQASKGSEAALQILDMVARHISRALSVVFHTFLPEMVILGGGVMEGERGRFVQAVHENLHGFEFIPLQRVRVEQAQLGNDAGMIGAAYLVFTD